MKTFVVFALICLCIHYNNAEKDVQSQSFVSKLVETSRVKRSPQDLLFIVTLRESRYRINCTKICVRGIEGNFLFDCNVPRFSKICGLCRISFRCGNLNQAFA